MDKGEILNTIKEGLDNTFRDADDPEVEMKVTVDGTPTDCEMVIEISPNEWFTIRAEKHTTEFID